MRNARGSAVDKGAKPVPDSNTVEVAKSRSILSAMSSASMPPARHREPVLAYWLSSSWEWA